MSLGMRRSVHRLRVRGPIQRRACARHKSWLAWSEARDGGTEDSGAKKEMKILRNDVIEWSESRNSGFCTDWRRIMAWSRSVGNVERNIRGQAKHVACVLKLFIVRVLKKLKLSFKLLEEIVSLEVRYEVQEGFVYFLFKSHNVNYVNFNQRKSLEFSQAWPSSSENPIRYEICAFVLTPRTFASFGASLNGHRLVWKCHTWGL